METVTNSLFERYNSLKNAHPQLRLREAAQHLHVSEAELIEAQVQGKSLRLKPQFQDILSSIPNLGDVMALTRNESVVHERKGTYQHVSFSGHVGLVLGEDIDLRLFLHQWKSAFVVEDDRNTSIQFFNAQGMAIHKIFLQAGSSRDAFQQLVDQFRWDDAEPLHMESQPSKRVEEPDTEIDIPAFQQAWRDLQDTHDFFPMLRKFKVSRTQALRLAPPGFAEPISMQGLQQVMHQVVKESLEIMVFVGNPGCIQIHTGPIHSWKPMGPWWNVLDPRFNLHLRGDQVASAFLVKKPTADGVVTSLELFDAEGEQLVQFFGKRKPGIPELPRWRGILQECL